MAYEIEITYDADDDIEFLPRNEQAIIREAFPRYLADTPTVPSNRRKPLDPNPAGVSWELRVGDLRALYNVDEDARQVRIVHVGKKVGNDLYIRHQRFPLRGQP